METQLAKEIQVTYEVPTPVGQRTVSATHKDCVAIYKDQTVFICKNEPELRGGVRIMSTYPAALARLSFTY